ncbi:MAG TPA: hypothetical protein VMA95_06930 [Streptosporangiaceae bacterium]|nr:hypothetical protein [Streptosporangiaceae bacterium]
MSSQAGNPKSRPAYYAAGPGRWRDWWTLLHPPFTAWHLAYVVLGAAIAPEVRLNRLLAAVGAFFLAVGVAAHALDEWQGRPLRTSIPSPALIAATVIGLAGAVGLGAWGVTEVGWGLVPFMIIGPLLVVGYNAELFGGVIHTDLGFAVAWGGFPALTGYVGQTGRLALAPVIIAAAATALSLGQRYLSTPARMLRRRTALVSGTITLTTGEVLSLDAAGLLAPLERALRSLSWGIVLLAAAVATARLA